MIVVHLDDIMRERNISIAELSEQVGITLANMYVLKNGKARAIRFSTLEAICQALDCQVGDILKHE